VSHSHHHPNSNLDFVQNSLNLLFDLGIRTVFAIPGAHIEHFILAIAKDNRFKLIIAAHEEGAGFIADGYFRKSNQVPIVATINGPGATNLMTSVSTAQVDHSSIIYLTGDTAYSLKDMLAFQTSSQLSDYTGRMFRSILSKQIIPLCFNDLYQGLNEYIDDFRSNIHYPMHISLHNDISKLTQIECESYPVQASKNILRNYSFNLERSVLILGEDIRNMDEINSVINYCSKHKIPIVCTLGAKNSQALIPKDIFCGVYGYAGHESAIDLVQSDHVERVYFLYTDLNERNTMAWSSTLFKENREVFAISPYPTNHGIQEFTIKSIECSMGEFIKSCHISTVQDDWFKEYIYGSKNHLIEETKQLDMTSSILIMNQMIDYTDNFVLDSGDHRIYGSLYWDVKKFNTFFTASKTAPMGWAIGAGIGVGIADTAHTTWVLTGDGCMLMHGNEISVAQRYHTNVKFIVINNGSFGRIEYRLLNEDDSIKNKIARLPYTSWVHYANSFNIEAICVKTNQELVNAIKTAQEYNGPYLIEIMITIDNETDIKSIFSSTSKNFKPFWKEENSNEKI